MTDKDIKFCKNKKCNKQLPEGYKHRYCESCRNKQAQKIKDIGKAGAATLSLAVAVISGSKLKK